MCWYDGGLDQVIDRTTNIIDYRRTSNISRTLDGSKIVDLSPVGAAPTTYSF